MVPQLLFLQAGQTRDPELLLTGAFVDVVAFVCVAFVEFCSLQVRL